MHAQARLIMDFHPLKHPGMVANYLTRIENVLEMNILVEGVGELSVPIDTII